MTHQLDLAVTLTLADTADDATYVNVAGDPENYDPMGEDVLGVDVQRVQPAVSRTDLYEFSTWQRTQRLEDLVSGKVAMTKADLDVLWTVYVEGTEDVGVAPTLDDFGMWLMGADPYERPADVIW